MASKSFTEEALREMLWGESDTLIEVERSLSGTSRWHTHFEVIFREKEGGKLYMTDFAQAATEHQEHDYPSGECVEVKPVEKTITVYEPVTDDATH